MAEERVILKFQSYQLDKPITYQLVKEFDLELNILQAKVTTEEGKLVLGLTGLEHSIEEGIEWLKAQGVSVEPLATGLDHDRDVCVDCGACTAVCPTGAVHFSDDWTLEYDEEKCILCLACVHACPVKAITEEF